MSQIAEQPATMASNGDRPPFTKEQIEAYRQQQLAECGRRLAELLQEYNCDLVAVPQFSQDGRIVAVIQLVAK